jgi:glycine/D-amino acid oxidase-like deaminating enzyme
VSAESEADVTIDPGPGDPDTTGGVLPRRAQVVIVGGGVTGCSIAYHLAHLGWTDVVLLEQHQLTAGTTWHAAGLLTSAGMTDETALFFSRYSRDLYARLEQETGHSTGFRPVGHISLATTPRRQEALRREAAWMHGLGVEDTEISPRELAGLWPLARTDDVLSAFYVADEGRADPVGVVTSLAKGARQLGVRVVEGVAATGVQTSGRRVRAVLTSAGPIETEVVVNAVGMWARQFGALAGVSVPLQAAEHYYLLTGTVPGMDPDLPVIEDPDNYGYYRPEGDGMLVGLFEPVAAPWSLDGVPGGFSFGKISPDWERMEPFLGPALDRIPVLSDTGVRTFFCGPESFTADVRPLLGPAPELDGYFVAAGLNSLGILSGGGVGSMLAHWIVDGCTTGWPPPAGTSRPRRAGSSPSGTHRPARHRSPARVTYVGELGWELHVPAEYAAGVYDDLVDAGRDLGFRLVGLSAMSSCPACGWKRVTATWASTSTTLTTPSRPGSGSRWPGTSPAGSPAATRCWPPASRGRPGTGWPACSPGTRPPICSATSRCSSARSGWATSGPPPTATRWAGPSGWPRSSAPTG